MTCRVMVPETYFAINGVHIDDVEIYLYFNVTPGCAGTHTGPPEGPEVEFLYAEIEGGAELKADLGDVANLVNKTEDELNESAIGAAQAAAEAAYEAHQDHRANQRGDR